MGDFYQFPPVKGLALWKEPRKWNAEDAKGLWIWHQFTNVIIVREQMRQVQDPDFRDFLDRVRTTTCTEEDGLCGTIEVSVTILWISVYFNKYVCFCWKDQIYYKLKDSCMQYLFPFSRCLLVLYKYFLPLYCYFTFLL
jgi:hypothetical protein